MTLSDFINKYKGISVCYPTGQYCSECLSLCKQYIKELFRINPPASGTNSAYGYWSNFPSPLPNKFIKVQNTPSGVPKEGDIIIWKPWSTNKYGHIAIFIAGNANNFKSFDQNYGGKQAHIQNHNYTNVIGWLSLKAKPAESEDKMLSPDEARQWYREFLSREPDEAYINGRQAIEFLQGACREHLQKRTEMQRAIDNLSSQVKELEKQTPDMSQYVLRDFHNIETGKLNNIATSLQKTIDNKNQQIEELKGSGIRTWGELFGAIWDKIKGKSIK